MRISVLLLCCVLALPATVLQVGGSVVKPLELDAKAFAALPQTTLESVALVCRSGAVKAPPQNRRGVLLSTLLDVAGLKTLRRGDHNRLVVLAEGRDGYGVAFSYHELFNNRTGEGVLVVAGPEGFSLYSQHDYITGPRHVRHLATIWAGILGKEFMTSKGHK